MTSEFKNAIDKYFSSEETKIFLKERNEEKDIQQTEKELNITFDNTYKYILLNYGDAYVGIDLLPCTKRGSKKAEQTILEITKSFRSSYLEFQVCNEIQSSYVISIDGSGDPIFITPNGNVKIYYHDNNEIEKLAENLKELILNNI
ncbi:MULTISPECIES: SMI1/KNR4 family protein [Sphingobacterium]|uniref:SMI1/KNR4 family protein n=1 Tax=Sphingobacterium kitahiroshimense TaxID=470446 RepID=A0ABV0BRZ4_9SPHI|nr:SMI1/KNR4 family protein [Sphingobacterium sp. JUb56]MBB2949772.1 hypothetical protein [Sphingobacterium sp. JUb56]